MFRQGNLMVSKLLPNPALVATTKLFRYLDASDPRKAQEFSHKVFGILIRFEPKTEACLKAVVKLLIKKVK
jgi:hypothetical protein